jgi:hypothetical protein
LWNKKIVAANTLIKMELNMGTSNN